MKYQTIIGRFEHVNFVGFIDDVPAKIDTGAYRSSVHAESIEEIKLKSGLVKLKFTLLGHDSSRKKKVITVRSFRKRKIVSSSGHTQTRYEVKLRISLAGRVFTTPFTLADRSKTVFPVLIGRKALNSRYLVDPSKSAISRMELKLAINGIDLNEEDLEGVNI